MYMQVSPSRNTWWQTCSMPGRPQSKEDSVTCLSGSWVWVRERCNVPQHTWPHQFHCREKDAAERVGCACLACAESGGGSSVKLERDFGQRVFQRNDGQDGVDDLEASSGGHMLFDRTMRKWDTAIAVQLVQGALRWTAATEHSIWVGLKAEEGTLLCSAHFPIWVEEIVCEQGKGSIGTQAAMSMTTRTRGVRWSETCAEAWDYDATVVRRRWN